MQMAVAVNQARTVQDDVMATQMSLAQLSFEIRDSLNTISLSAELLAHSQQTDPEKQQEYYQYIQTAVQRLTELLAATLEA